LICFYNSLGARIYAQNAIRKKNEALNYLRLASRIDAVAARMDTALKMNNVTQSMSSIVMGMDKVLESMNVNKIAQVMDKFEKQFDTLDVTSEYMENAMSTSTSSTTPEDQVNQLMVEVADEYGLEVSGELGGISTSSNKASAAANGQDDLSARLARLKQN
jgi:charged multivesicular body protein 1